MRSLALMASVGLLGCVSFPSAHLVIDATEREAFAAPVVCGPMGFRKAPLQSRWGEYVRVTVGSQSVLRGTAFVHANGASGEPRTWTTAEGNLVIEARFENLDPDARYALLRDRPIDVTITNLEAVSGTCEGAVFTVEQGELIPNIDERMWIAELERRGGSELAERREALRIEMEVRRQAHYAAWEARGAGLVADVAVREAHYAAWDARRAVMTTLSPDPAGEGWGEGQTASASVATNTVGGSAIVTTGSTGRTNTPSTTCGAVEAMSSGTPGYATCSGGATTSGGATISGSATVSGSTIVSGCATCGSGAVGGSTMAGATNTTISGSTIVSGCATCGSAVGGSTTAGSTNTTISGSTIVSGCATCGSAVGGSTMAGSTNTISGNTTAGCATCGSGTIAGSSTNTTVSGSIVAGCATCGSGAIAGSSTNTTVGGSTIATASNATVTESCPVCPNGTVANATISGCPACLSGVIAPGASATVVTNIASAGINPNATVATGDVYARGVLVEAPPSSIEWTAYPTAPQPTTASVEWTSYPATPALEPVAVSIETSPTPIPQPVCDESCQAAHTLGFILPAVFDVLLNVPAPQPPPSRVVKAVPLGNR